MKKFATWMGMAVLGLSLVGPSTARAIDGELFGGLDLFATKPLNALNRTNDEGGGFAPFLGYMLFKPTDRRLNIGAKGQMGTMFLSRNLFRNNTFDGRGNIVGTAISRKNAMGFFANIGPHVRLPIGKVELNGEWLVGLLTGLNSGPISDTSWGFQAGGGIDYKLTENLKVGAFANWNRYYQRVRGIGDVRYVNAGLRLTANSGAPEAPPPPPPPPPPAAPKEEVVVPAPKKKIVLRGVNFDFDKANIRGDARVILDEAVRILKSEGGSINVVAEGHTDAVGSDAYNQGLSVRRAKAVREYLVKGGIDPSRITSEGFGESRPVATNETKDGRAQNRRVELRVAQ